MNVLRSLYQFHHNSKYWNNTFGTESTSIGRPHIWQAFVQETLRTIAEESEIDIELNDALNIKEVTSQAFAILGENGIIRAADKHACSESIVGVDQNDDAIPGLAADIPENDQEIPLPDSDDGIDIDNHWVTMNVLDGVVMGPQALYVIYIMCSLLLGVWFRLVPIKELKELMHVKHTSRSGRSSKSTIAAKSNLGFAECYKGHQKFLIGNLVDEDQIHKDMMIQVQIHHYQKTTSALVNIIVLKLSVHHVVLLLHGLNLQEQNQLQIF
ncbi:hypothetical protein BDZ97DRAFT_1751506 [Flammula alnicola]|nr:hypothetical protein BDZ97DRAFT_1751506 [Flammula alnicola]